MLILSSTSDEIRVTTSAATPVAVHASWSDKNGTTITPDRTNTAISTATTTPVVSSPASSQQRTVRLLTINNNDTSVHNVITVTQYDGTLGVNLLTVDLGPGEAIHFSDDGFKVFDSHGNIKTSSGISAVGSDTQIQFNDGGTYVGTDTGLIYDKTAAVLGVRDTNSSLELGSYGSGTPAAPASGVISVFGRTVAGRHLLAQVGPSGLDSALQPFLARNKIGYWNPPGNATTVPGVFGITALTAQGTATARNVATTSLATRMRRLGYPSSATAGTFAGARLAVAQFSCGSGSPDGSGFFLVERWVESDPAPVSGRRAFHGMTSTTGAFTNVEVDTLLNHVGIMQLSTDSTQWYWKQAGSSTNSGVAIGTTIGAPGGNSTTAWELAIFAPNGIANTYYAQLTNLTTGVVATNTFTGAASVLPQSSTLLAWNAWATNNATAAAVGIDLCSLYIETDS